LRRILLEQVPFDLRIVELTHGFVGCVLRHPCLARRCGALSEVPSRR
jgi:hypothetical protein